MNKLAAVALCVLASPLCLAQKQSDFVLGRLLKIAADANSLAPGRENYKPNYLLKMRTSEGEFIALYHVKVDQQRHVEALKENSDVPYKISGKNLFLKTPDGRELKLLLCATRDKAIVCGDDIFPKME